MDNKLWILVQAQYRNHSGINAFFYEKGPKKRHRSIGMALAVLLVGVMLIGYCFAIGYGLGYLGMAEVIPGYALAITGIVTILFTFIKTNGYLFACKDYDMLMALPLSNQTVITARFLYMYFNNLLFTVGVMLPMGIGYMIWTKPPLEIYVMWLIGMLMAPLLPMTLAAALGALITAIGSRFRFKTFVEVLLSVVLLFGIFGGSFYLQGMSGNEAVLISKITDIGEILSEQMHKIYPLSAWFDQAVNEGKIVSFILFLLASVLWYGIFVVIVGRFYGKINTALTTYHAQSNYQMQGLKTSSIRMTIVKKEAKRFFSSSIYLMNMGIGLIIALGTCVAMLLFGMDRMLTLMELPELGNGFIYVVPFMIAMIVNMSCTTAVSLSLEGKNLWVVKSLPISAKTLLEGKMLFNLILVMPVSVVCNILMMATMGVSLMQAVLYLLISVVTVLLSTVWGMWINLHFPNYTWDNEVQVIKQSITSLFGICSGMIGYLILAVITYFMSSIIAGELVLVIVSVILLVLSGLCYRSVTHAKIAGDY